MIISKTWYSCESEDVGRIKLGRWYGILFLISLTFIGYASVKIATGYTQYSLFPYPRALLSKTKQIY